MRILFAGTGDIGVPTLRFLAENHELVGILTQPDRPAGRHRHLKPPAIKEEAGRIARGIPLFQPESPRLPEVLPWIQSLKPEVMVTMAYGRILPREILELPPIACLNIHASLLPRHRGASPIQSSIACGDEESGVSVMFMAEGLDTGDVLLERRLRLLRRETAGSLSLRLANLAALSLRDALGLLQLGTAPRIPQDHALATVCGKITREHCRLDWRLPARALEQKIRSLQPRPAAFTTLQLSSGANVVLKVHSAILATRSSGVPGSLLRVDDRGLLVACGEGSLLLGNIQPEGKGIMHSSAFIRGHALEIGSHLG